MEERNIISIATYKVYTRSTSPLSLLSASLTYRALHTTLSTCHEHFDGDTRARR